MIRSGARRASHFPLERTLCADHSRNRPTDAKPAEREPARLYPTPYLP